MGLFDWFKKKQKPAGRKLYSADWHPMGSYGYRSPDAYGRSAPTPNDLIAAFEDTVYSCSSLIANKIATTPIHLYVKTDQGQAKPKCLTRPVSRKTFDRIASNKVLTAQTRVEEVVSHPAIDLLNKCNSYHNQGDLLCLTELFLEITGNAFWLMKPDNFGLPCELYLLPTQFVSPVRDESGMVKGWRFGQGNQEVVYDKSEIIHFKFPSLDDPYGWGMSPLQAAWNRVMIGLKETGYLDATLTNGARPDAILAPSEPISPFEADRLAKDFTQRFRGAGSGGVIVADGPMTITPIGWPPRDLAELQLYQTIKTNVCNCFAVPPDIWEMGESNRATAEAALYALAVHCLKPRMCRLIEKLNERLIPFFDDRLFFEADDIVPEDKTFELSKMQFLASTGSITRNEIRIREGLEPKPWGEEPLLPPGMLPALPPDDDEPDTYQEPTQDRSGQAPGLAQLQQAVYAGQLPRLAAIANVQVTFGFSADQAEALFPDVAPVKTTPDEPDQADQSNDSQPDQADNQDQADDKPPQSSQEGQGQAEVQPEDKSVKEVTSKAVKRVNPLPMAEALQRFFRHQRKALLSKVKLLDEAQTKALPMQGWFDLEDWTKEMAAVMRPIVALYYDDSAKATTSRIGASPDLLKVVQPNLDKALEKATLLFCKETNEATSQELGEAIKSLRQSLAEGLEAGEVQNQLMARVGEIFESAETMRSYRIAVTEASRAQHSAQEITAQESGLVQGKKWLCNEMACPKCLPLNGKVVPLGSNFATDESQGAYSNISTPPRHPHCMCTMTEVIEGAND